MNLYKFIKSDKLLHFVFGLSIAAVMYPFGYIVMLTSVLILAIVKEIYDKAGLDSEGKGTPDFLDILATVSGALFLVVWYECIALYLSRYVVL